MLVEGGFAWLAAADVAHGPRMGTHARRVPHVKKPPSEYVKSNVWLTTQPIEEPEINRHLYGRGWNGSATIG